MNEEVVENENIESEEVEVTENTVAADTTYSEQLNQIHTDLGFIICFIVFFVLVVLLKYTYKFFDMVFKF